MLEELQPNRRLQIVNDILTHEVDVLSLEMQMEQKVRQRVAQVQKDMILREQVKVLQHELGDDGDEEIAEYTEKIQRAKLPEEVHKRLTKEVERLAKQPFGSAEASVIRNYLDVSGDAVEQVQPRTGGCGAGAKLLDRDHYGLEKVKERILEFIAVRQLNPDAKGKILCLVGPSGRGQDLGSHLGGQGYEPEAGAAQSGRCAGRGGYPRSPQDLHWSHAGAHHRGYQPRRGL